MDKILKKFEGNEDSIIQITGLIVGAIVGGILGSMIPFEEVVPEE